MSIITVNTEDATTLVQEGGKFVFKPEAEQAILTLLELRDFIDEKIKEVEIAIESAGNSIDSSSFKGVIGEKVRAIYRAYAQEYKLGDNPSKEFIKEKITQYVNTEEVKKYKKKHNKLPNGILENDKRTKKISLITYEPKNAIIAQPDKPLLEE